MPRPQARARQNPCANGMSLTSVMSGAGAMRSVRFAVALQRKRHEAGRGIARLRAMKFEELHSRRQAREPTQEQAAEASDVPVRTLRHWEDRAVGRTGMRRTAPGGSMTAASGAWRATGFRPIRRCRRRRFSTRGAGTTHGEALSREAGLRARVHGWLQPGSPDASEPWPGPAGGAAPTGASGRSVRWRA